MKDFLKTRQGMVIAVMGAVIIVLLGILVVGKLSGTGKGASTEISAEKAKEDAKSPYNLYKGHWYSDREDRSEIVLEKDGTYTGTGWVNSGRYEFVESDSAIEFRDSLDGIKTLVLKTIDGETVLQNEKGTFNFYHSKEQLEKAIAEKEKEDAANQELFKQKWLDVLTKGEWAEIDGIPCSVNFTVSEDKISYEIILSDYERNNNGITIHGGTQTDTFKIEETESLTDTFVEYTLSSGGTRSFLTIKEEDGKYTLRAPFLPWFQSYTIDVESVELTQQGITESDGAKEKETVTEFTDSEGNKVTKTEKVIDEKDGWD